ncbi:MAG: MlaD family protein [Planctomycetota bacterium]
MKRKPDHRLRAGVMLTLFVGLLFVLVFSLDSTLSWWRHHRSVSVRFDHVQGLMRFDPVHFHGVPCGRVLELSFAGAQEDGRQKAFAEATEASGGSEGEGASGKVHVLATLEVPEQVYKLLRTGSRASIEKTLTGITVVNLEQRRGDPLTAGSVIEGRATATMDEVTTEILQAGRALTRVLEGLEPIVDGLREGNGIAKILETLEETSLEARELASEMRSVLQDNATPLRRVVERTVTLVDRVQGTLDELPDAVAELRLAARHAGDLAVNIDEWLEMNTPRLSATTEDIASSAENLKALSAELRRRPWRLLHSPSRDEARELGLYESATMYATGALEVRRALDRVEELLSRRGEDPGRRVRLDGALDGLQASLERQHAFEETFWRRLQELWR